MTPKEVRDDIVAAMNAQRVSMEALTTGLDLMRAGLAAQNEMLRAILAACAPDPQGSPLVEALERIAQTMEQNGGTLLRIEAALPRLAGAREDA